MIRRPLARALLLGLALTLAAPAAWAAPPSGGETGIFTRLLHALTTSWADLGCWLDLYGGCGVAQTPTPPPDTEVGCWLDPGGCGTAQAPALPPSQIDEGCWLDPHGGCRTGG